MLMQIYAVEYTDTHFLSVAPGLIETDMQIEVRETNINSVPNVIDFRKKKEIGEVSDPNDVSKKIISLVMNNNYESGGFVDLRTI